MGDNLPFVIVFAAICAVASLVIGLWQHIDKADAQIAKARNEIAEYEARRDAYMRECVPKESAQRCLDLFRWTQPQ